MSELVEPTRIEAIVGTHRRAEHHLGRAVSAEQQVYVLHSTLCLESGIDLRECGYSKALDLGIDLGYWWDYEDQPVVLGIEDRRLIPLPLGSLDLLESE